MQYNVLKATKAGEPWAGSLGGTLQTWFLDIENYQGTIRCNRKVESPILNGPTWGELTHATSKQGKPYMNFKVKAAPEVLPGQTSLAGPDIDNAPLRVQLDRIERNVDRILEIVRPTVNLNAQETADFLGGTLDDQPPVDLYDKQIGALDDPPF